METAYSVIYLIAIVGFALCICGCLLRAIIGPKTMDRIVAVNMIGTMSIIIIAVVSLYLNEEFLLDVDLVYAMLSFLAVVVLTKVYMGVHKEEQILQERRLEREKKRKERKEAGNAVEKEPEKRPAEEAGNGAEKEPEKEKRKEAGKKAGKKGGKK